MNCPDPNEMVEERIDRVLTQYRESPNLLHVIRTYLAQAVDAMQAICAMPEAFALETAVGDQLTLLGERMGWPRCHCVCVVEPVFGFNCNDDGLYPLLGFCEPGNWANCTSSGVSDICIEDDEIYRKFLQVRRYQYLNLYDLASLETCLRIFFGNNAAVMIAGEGRVCVAPGRPLTALEISLLPLYVRVLPVALGINITFHFGARRVFGFGDGWGGFNEPDYEATQETLAYQKTGKIFGFCPVEGDSISGFCADWAPDGLPIDTGLVTADGDPVLLVDEDGNLIYTGPLTADPAWVCRSSAPWLCETNVHPYDC